jgi:hypothetical protein
MKILKRTAMRRSTYFKYSTRRIQYKYINTFIEIAQDCPVAIGEIPAAKKSKNRSIQFD